LTLDQVVERLKDRTVRVPIQGDLGLIAAKALEAEPDRRYGSVDALAADVERYLSGAPVQARRASWGYRAGRFVRRHAWAVASASAAVLLLAGTAGWALRQQYLAEERFRQVRSLARALLFEIHDSVSKAPGTLEARKEIVERGVQYLERLAADRGAGDDVQRDVAEGFLRLSDLEGKDFGGASLGRSKEALAHAGRAVEIGRRLVASRPADRQARAILVDGLDYVTTAATLRGENEAAVRSGREAVEQAERLVREEPGSAGQQARLATVTKQLASAEAGAEHMQEALRLYERSIEMREQLYQADPRGKERGQRLAEAHQWAAGAYWQEKRYEEAERHGRAALRIAEEARKLEGPALDVTVAAAALLVGNCAAKAKRYDEAVELIGRALEARQRRWAAEPKSVPAGLRVASALNRLANVYREWGRLGEAAKSGAAGLELARQMAGRDAENVVARRELVYALVDLALTSEKAGQRARACALAGEAAQVAERSTKGLKAAEKSLAQAAALRKGC